MRNNKTKRAISAAMLVMMLAKITSMAWAEHVHASEIAHPPVEIGTGEVAVPPAVR